MLDELLTPHTIRSLAPERAFTRGEEYARDGAVAAIKEADGRVQAFVNGQRTYDVALWAEGARVQWRCSCPMGAAGEFCKHCVAVALAWTGQVKPAPKAKARAKKKTKKKSGQPTRAEIREFLRTQPVEVLVEALIKFASKDREMLRDLSLQTQIARAFREDPVAEIGEMLPQMLQTKHYLSEDQAEKLAGRIHEALNALEAATEGVLDARVIAICEAALPELGRLVANSLYEHSPGLEDVGNRLLELHRMACAAAPPDPEKLAGTLVSLAVDAGAPLLDAAEDYEEALGEKGLECYARLVAERLEKLPAKQKTQESFDYRALLIMQKCVMEVSKDTDSVLAYLGERATTQTDYLEIAHVCVEAGRLPDAVTWLERGEATLVPAETGHLMALLVEIHLTMGDIPRAEAACWRLHEKVRNPGSFAVVRRAASNLGCWDAWRPRALRILKEATSIDGDKGAHPRYYYVVASDAYLDVLLEEGMVDEAWAECFAMECTIRARMDVTRRRGETHPADAIPEYVKIIDFILGHANAAAYRDVVDLLGELKPLMERVGQLPFFFSIIARIREAYPRRKALLRLLDKSELTAM